MLTSARRGLSYPNTTRTDAPDIPAHIKNLVDALEIDVIFGQGLASSRPISSVGTAGIPGRVYYSTDTGILSYDYGTGWTDIGAITVSAINRVDVYANRPAASAVPVGTKYFATDQVAEYVSNGSAWLRISMPAGVTAAWFASAAPAGWIKYDGGALPGTTGIYADLYAHLAAGSTPDTRGRAIFGQGTHSDVAAIQASDGLAVGSRRSRHKHLRNGGVSIAQQPSFADSGHRHEFGGDGGLSAPAGATGGGYNPSYGGEFTSYNSSNIYITAGVILSDTISIGPQTGAEPTDGVAFITGVYIAKL